MQSRSGTHLLGDEFPFTIRGYRVTGSIFRNRRDLGAVNRTGTRQHQFLRATGLGEINHVTSALDDHRSHFLIGDRRYRFGCRVNDRIVFLAAEIKRAHVPLTKLHPPLLGQRGITLDEGSRTTRENRPLVLGHLGSAQPIVKHRLPKETCTTSNKDPFHRVFYQPFGRRISNHPLGSPL